MKSTIIISAMVLSASLLAAQTAEKSTTVRVKKIENINGVEKITDTTFSVNGPRDLKTIESLTAPETNCKKSGKPGKIVIVTDQVKGGDADVKVVNKEDVIDEQMERALKAAGMDGKNVSSDKVMVVNVESKDTGENGEKKTTKIIIVKNVKITDPTEADTKMLGKPTGLADGQLALDKMNFYPNPSNGKFNLAFNLPKKGDTEITILNTEGKLIYEENLPAFIGNYDKEIDISQNPKGVYFVKIQQDSHAQLKKIVLE